MFINHIVRKLNGINWMEHLKCAECCSSFGIRKVVVNKTMDDSVICLSVNLALDIIFYASP